MFRPARGRSARGPFGSVTTDASQRIQRGDTGPLPVKYVGILFQTGKRAFVNVLSQQHVPEQKPPPPKTEVQKSAHCVVVKILRDNR